MRSAELRQGRVFVLRLEDGEVLHEAIESFCVRNGIARATVSMVGAVDAGSVVVCGPKVPVERDITPIQVTLDAPRELTGFGTVFSDGEGRPTAHLHGSVGRDGESITCDFRPRTVVWLVMEVVITELIGEGPVRKPTDRLNAKLLEIERWHRKRFSERLSTTPTANLSPNTRTSRDPS